MFRNPIELHCRPDVRPIFFEGMVVFFISFTLFPAHSTVDRGNQMLRRSVPQFPANSGGITCWVAELNGALFLDRSDEIKKKIISANPQPSCLQCLVNMTSCVYTCVPAPQLLYMTAILICFSRSGKGQLHSIERNSLNRRISWMNT